MKIYVLWLFAALVSFISRCLKKIGIHSYGSLFYRLKVYIKLCILRTICSDTLQRYKSEDYINRYYIQDVIPPHIYVLWLQGLDNAPELVKTCIRQLSSLKDYTIEILDQKAIDSLPLAPIFIKKFKEGKITRTHLSDIIRLFLLSHNGGIWCDSTLLVYDFPAEMKSRSFYSVRRYITNSNDKYNPAILYTKDGLLAPWTSYFFASSKNNVVTLFAYDMLTEFHTKHSELIDYFLIDMVFRLGYEDISIIHKQIDSISINNNGHIHDLFYRLNDTFDQDTWDELCYGSTANMFKLSWKNFEPIGGGTYWSHIKHKVSRL